MTVDPSIQASTHHAATSALLPLRSERAAGPSFVILARSEARITLRSAAKLQPGRASSAVSHRSTAWFSTPGALHSTRWVKDKRDAPLFAECLEVLQIFLRREQQLTT